MKEERKRILVVVVKWGHGVNGLFTAETFAYQFFSLKVAIEWKILQLEVSDEIMNLNYTSIIFNKSSDIMIPLICVGCSVQIIREVILRLHFRRRWHTFASFWSACLRFVSLWRGNSRGVSCVFKGLLRSDILSSY